MTTWRTCEGMKMAREDSGALILLGLMLVLVIYAWVKW